MYDLQSHPLPANFRPEVAATTIRSITQAIYQLCIDEVMNGLPADQKAVEEFHAALEGLAYAACCYANQLDAHYREEKEALLPYVREDAAVYDVTPG